MKVAYKLTSNLFLFIFLFFVVFEGVGQTPVSALHETPAQTQIAVTFSGVGFSNDPADYIVDGGAIAVSNVVVSGNVATLLLASVIPAGTSTITVEYNGVTIVSQNNKVISCDDFVWDGVFTPTPACAPVDPITKMVFSVSPGARNSSNWNVSNLRIRAFWGAGAAGADTFIVPFESNSSGSAATDFFITGDASTNTFTYPDNDPVCSYESVWRVQIGLSVCPVTNPGQLVTYSSHNEDSEGGGNLDLEPTVANSDLVCLNDEVNMSFSDVSTLNCIADPDQPNVVQRHVRVRYGDPSRPDADRIPNIYVGGVQVTDDNGTLVGVNGGNLGNVNVEGYIPVGTNALGTSDSYGVVAFPTPVVQLPAGVLEQITSITTVAGQLNRNVGQQFHVIIEYWNICNEYDLFGDQVNNNSVSTFDFIEIIDIPPLPNPVDGEICQGDGLGGVNFGINGAVGTVTAVNWFDDDPNTGGNPVTNPNGTNSTFFPASSFPGGLNTNVPGEYSMWATYVIGATNSCESDPVESVITVREDLNQPDAITGSSVVCNGTNDVTFSLPSPAGSTTFGGAAEYEWSTTGGGGVNLDATTGQTITADFNIGGSFTPSTTRTVRVRRKYSAAPDCYSSYRNFTVTIYNNTLGGMVNSDDIICEGESTGILTLTGHRGDIIRWERQVNGGGFVDIGNPGSTTFQETLGAEGTYDYRAIVENGVCSTEASADATIIVNPVPAKPTITEVGAGTDICADGSQVILQSDNVDGDADEYAWFRDPDLVNPVQQGSSNQLVLDAVNESGDYYVQTIGIDPSNCESQLSDPISVVINPLPTATVTGGGSVCAGNPAPPAVVTLTGTGPYNITYTRDGVPTTANGITSPYTIPGSTSVVDGVDDTYEVTSVTDLGTSINCTVNTPSANITGSAVIAVSAIAPPAIESVTVETAVCDDGAGTDAPDIIIDLSPDDNTQQYDITYTINGGTSIVLTNQPVDASGVFRIQPDYTVDLGGTPGTYSYEITSIVNVTSSCTATGLPSGPHDVIINPRPAAPTNPLGAIACSTDLTGATLSVDAPPAGNVIHWYQDASLTVDADPAFGVVSGGQGELFTPSSTATATFYAVVESNTTPTNCQSVNSVAVIHTQDLAPSSADADADDDLTLLETCTDQITLGAVAADNGGSGIWTYSGLLFYEDFESAANGTTEDNDLFGWSRNTNLLSLDADTHFEVRNNYFEARDLDGIDVDWVSNDIDISAVTNIDISIDVAESGVHEGTDHIEVYYQIDANPVQLIASVNNNFSAPDGTFVNLSGSFVSGGGSMLKIIVRVQNSANDEFLRFDNIVVRDQSADALSFSDISDENAVVSGLSVGTTTLTWNVSSDLGICNPTSQIVDVIRNPLPVANDPLPELCEELPQSSNIVTGVDLTVYNDQITGIVGSTGRTVQFFTDPPPVNLIIDPTDVDVSQGTIIYTRVTDDNTSANTSCTQDGTITFTVHSLPDAVDQGAANLETVFCEETVGSGDKDDIDLTTLNDNVTNGASDRTVEWFADPGVAVAIPSDLTGFEIISPADEDVDNVQNGDIFYAVVTDNNTLCQDIATVEFTINPRPVDNSIITPDNTTPASYTICKSSNIQIFQVDDALNAGSTYSWSVPTGAGEFVQVGGSNDFFVLLRFPNEVLAPGLPVTVTETTADGCVGNTNTIMVIVDDAPAKPIIAGDSEVCTGQQNVTYSITLPTGGSTYTWNVPGTLGSIVSGQGTDEIVVNIGTASGNITVTETSSAGCTSPAADPFGVTVNPRPVMTSSNAEEICSGGSVNSVLTFTSDIPGSTFAWEVISKTGPIGGASVGQTGTGNIAQVLTNTSGAVGSVTYEVTPTSPDNCDGNTQVVVITVNPEPVGQNDLELYCSDVPLNYDIQVDNINALGNSLTSTFTYTVASSDPGNVPTGPNRTVASGNPINDTYTNTGAANVDITYSITPFEIMSGSNCTGSGFDVVFRIRPEPVIDPALSTLTVCSDEILNLTLATNGTSIVADRYDISLVSQDVNLIGLPTTGTNLSATALLNDNFENTSNTNGTIIYRVVPKSPVANGDCSGDAFDITVTVAPEPVMDPTLSTLRLCSDETLNITLATNGTSITADRYDITLISQSANLTGTPTVGTDLTANALSGDSYENVSNTSGNIVYRVVPKSAVVNGDCSGDAFDITVTVDPESVMDPALASSVICSGESLNLTLATNGSSVAADRFDITLISQDANLIGTPTSGTDLAANSLVNDSFENTSNTSGDVIYRIVPKSAVASGDCSGDAFDITVTVDPEPVIDPALANWEVCSDEILNLTLATNGSSVAADRYDIILVSQSPNVTGTPTTGVDLTPTALVNDNFINVSATGGDVVYRVTPKSAVADGNCIGETFDITVTIHPEPVIDPALSNFTVCSDDLLNITLTTNGSSVSADRYDISLISQDPNLTGTPTVGVDLADNALVNDRYENVSGSSGNVIYQVIPKSAAADGDCFGDAFTIAVTVDPEPVIDPALAIQTICSGDVLGVTLATNGTSIGADRYDIVLISQDANVSGTPTSGVNQNASALINDTFENISGSSGNVVYRITPKSTVADGNCAGDPFDVTVIVNPEPVMDPSLATLTICSEDLLGINLTTNGTSIGADRFDIDLISQDANLTGVPTTGVDLAANAISNDLFENVSNTSGEVAYRITPKSSVADGDCIGDPFVITVTVDPEPVMDPSLASLTVCSDEILNLTLASNGTSVAADRFDIGLVSQDAFITGTPSTGSDRLANALVNDSFENLTNAAGTVIYRITPKSSAVDGDCIGNSFDITVTIQPEPSLDPALANTIICSDEPLGVVLTTAAASIGADRYDVSLVSQDANLTGTATTGSDLPANTLAGDSYENISNISGDVVYRVTPKSSAADGNCTGDPFDITITINPEPVVDPALASLTVCSDEVLNLTLVTNGTSIGADRYDIAVISQDANLTGTPTSGVDLSDNAIINDSYQNVSNLPGNIIYRVTPKSAVADGDCVGNSFNITVTVNPEPVMNPALSTTTVCSDESLNLTLNTNGISIGADRYDVVLISQDANLTGTPTTGSDLLANALINDSFENVSSTSGNVVYSVTPKSSIANGDCTGDDFIITVTVDPEPVMDPALASLTLCSDESLNLTLTTNGTSVGADRFNITLVSQDADLTGTATVGVDLAASALVADSFENLTNTPLDVVYEVTPKSAAADGDCTGDPFNITVTVQPEPVIDPSLSTLTVCSDEILSLTLFTTATGLGADRYDIALISQDPNVSGTPTTGVDLAANALINDSFENISAVPGAVVYEIIPKGSAVNGDCTGDPFNITVTVNPEPVVDPALATLDVCSDEPLNMILTTNGASIGADRYNVVLVSQGANISGIATTGTDLASSALINDNFENVSSTTGDVVYEVTPISAAADGDCIGDPFVVTVTVHPEPVIDPALATTTVCSDETLNIILATNGTSIAADRYDISLISQDAYITGTATVGVDLAANALVGDSFENLTNSSGTIVYQITPKSSVADGDCIGDPFTITITVNPEPVMDPALANITVCSDELLSFNLGTSATSIAANRYDVVLVSQDVNVTGTPTVGLDLNAAALFNDSFENLSNTSGDVVYSVTPKSAVANGDCIGNPFTIAVTISPEPVVDPALATLDVCSDEPLNMTLITNGTSISADRYDVALVSQSGNLTGGPTTGSDLAANALANDTYENVSGSDGLVVYRITPKSAAVDGDCIGDPFDITVTVHPEPVMDPTLATANVCSSEITGVVFNTNGVSVGAASYDVSIITQNAALSGTPTVGSGLAANAIENDVFTNVTSTPLTVVYRITPRSGAADGDCIGDPFDIAVTVDPEPVLNAGLDNSGCSDDITNITLSTNGLSVAANTYRLEGVNIPVVAGFSAGVGNAVVGSSGNLNLIRNDTYTNTSSTAVTVTYQIRPISVGSLACEGAIETIDYEVLPEPVLDLSLSPAPVCSDVAFGYTLNTVVSSVSATSYHIISVTANPNLTPVVVTTGNGLSANALAGDMFTNVTSSPLTVVYRVIPVSGDNCEGDPEDITFTVNPAPEMVDLDAMVCSDEASGIVLATTAVSVGAATYDIMDVRVAAGLTANAANASVGVTADVNEIAGDIFTNNTNGPLTVEYDVVPISAATCRGAETPPATIVLTVEPNIIADDPADENLCSGETTAITLTSPTNPSSGDVTFNYSAVASGAVTGFIPALNNLPENFVIAHTLVNNDNTPQTVTYTITPVASAANEGAGCKGASETVVVTVEPRPVMNVSSTVQTVCEGDATSIELTTPTTPSSGSVFFRLDNVVANGGVTGTSVIGDTFNSGDFLTDVLSNPSNSPQQVIYTFTPVTSASLGNGGACEGASVDVTITVNPEPNVVASQATVDLCSGDILNVSFSEPQGVSNTLFKWTVADNPQVTGESDGFGNLLFQVLFNNSNTTQTLIYTVTPESNGCEGPSSTVTVNIAPTPNINLASNFIFVCEGDPGNPLSIELDGDVAGTTFFWTATSSNADLSGYSAGSGTNGDFIDQVIYNNGIAPGTVTYTIRPVGSTGCEGTPQTVIASVGPRITGQFLSSDIVKCNDTNPTFLTMQFTGIPPFEVEYSDGTSNTLLTGIPNFHVLQVNPTVTTTYSIVSVTDANGCSALPANQTGTQSVTVTVSEVDATFQVVGDDTGCSPLKVTFSYDQVLDVTYTWSWFDGSPDSTYTATGTVTGQTVEHVFENQSTGTNFNVDVRLTAQLPPAQGSCIDIHSESITVFSTIRPNVIANGPTTICSGGNVSFSNFTLGASTHKWFYRRQGVNEEIDVRATSAGVNYDLFNTSSQNPLVYEVVYQGGNGNCSIEEVIPVTVYREVTPLFTVNNVTEFVGGSATLDLSNASNPLDDADFSYNWSFGTDASPATFTGLTPPTVTYTSPGPKTVTLTITNPDATAAGLNCDLSYTEIINIILPPIIADFEVEPVSGCMPLEVAVIENNSTGDAYSWEVINQLGNTILTSQEANPTFVLVTPGLYDIVLTTSNSITGQTAIATQSGIEVYQMPVASFDLRPDLVYLPDQPLRTFNYSDGANRYLWDFGDGTTADGFEPEHLYTYEGVFTVTLEASMDHGNGVVCATTGTKEIVVQEGGATRIPNAFTPNPDGPSGDGRIVNEVDNDIFLPITQGVEEFQMLIFDRWGNLIFESNDQTVGWDGYDKNDNLLPAGVYVYKITLRLSNGDRTTRIGDLTLIR
ncbi:gliding motility-associated C-terminal domain-containing protein [Fulvivirga sp. 29W222]|uniref:Gliding motility-associated C-terminal domain-containing protein n=1 Tax=Fulvivirga marina TaxID=2494733 RepID=A0A937KE92_9BACT|nr:PKD-like domain-containing protein [Fulvivirga marina]MBL6449492.1 gliding motility-associated C-terminal domain-containing protein [Fulvivirga marina]